MGQNKGEPKNGIFPKLFRLPDKRHYVFFHKLVCIFKTAYPIVLKFGVLLCVSTIA